MMDAAEQQIVGARLDRALADAGIVIEWPDQQRGNVRWRPVVASTLIGRLLQFGWRIVALDGQPVFPSPLRLVKDADATTPPHVTRCS